MAQFVTSVMSVNAFARSTSASNWVREKCVVVEHFWFTGLLLLPVLYEFAFSQTVFVATEQGQRALSVIPVWAPMWYTAIWLTFAALAPALFASAPVLRRSLTDTGVRRATVVAVGCVYTLELASRLATRHLPTRPGISPVVEGALGVGMAVVTAVFAARPPRRSVLIGLLLLLGLGLRVAGLVVIPMNAEVADNLPAISAGLDRLLQGGSPYGFYTVGGHTTSMAYLPLTVLAYLPAKLAGFDIRATNVVLSLAECVAMLAIVRTLRVRGTPQSALLLACMTYYVLPLNLGHDLYNEFQTSDLALVVGLGLLLNGRLNRAALAFGIALGAMPTGVFFAAALLTYVTRHTSPREAGRLVLIVVMIAVLPIAFLLSMNPDAFVQVVTYEAGDQWGHVTGAVASAWPYAPLWYEFGANVLKLIQVALLVLLACVAALRVRTAAGAAQLGAVSYLLMLLTGPQSGSHVLAAVVPLMLVAMAATVGESQPARSRGAYRAWPAVLRTRGPAWRMGRFVGVGRRFPSATTVCEA